MRYSPIALLTVCRLLPIEADVFRYIFTGAKGSIHRKRSPSEHEHDIKELDPPMLTEGEIHASWNVLIRWTTLMTESGTSAVSPKWSAKISIGPAEVCNRHRRTIFVSGWKHTRPAGQLQNTRVKIVMLIQIPRSSLTYRALMLKYWGHNPGTRL